MRQKERPGPILPRSSLNLHTHFHVCVIDGVFEPDAQGGIRFYAVDELDADDAEAVQTRVRRRILRAFVRRGILDKDDRKEMELWNHGGGFSLDATVRIEANDRRGLERLLRYCARPPFAAQRIEELGRHRLIYHLQKPGPDGRTQLILSCPTCGTEMRIVAFIAPRRPPCSRSSITLASLLRRHGSPRREGLRHETMTPEPFFSMKRDLQAIPSPNRSRTTNSISA